MLEEVMEIALKRGFLIPSNEIYGHIAGFYDYGTVGCALKRRIENLWRDMFIKKEGFFEIETVTILPEIVLEASGHVSNFADPLVSCLNCKKKFRADHLIGDKTKEKAEGLKPEELNALIEKYNLRCPECKGELEPVKWFNLMFKTNIGAIEGHIAYSRPETAQGIFVNFPRIFRAHGSKLPLGIAQIGKSYRNEISPRQGLLRLREFTQMELEYFFNPKDQAHQNFKSVQDFMLKIYTKEEQLKRSEKSLEITAKDAVKEGIIPNEILAYFMVQETQFYQKLGIPYEMFRFRHMLPEETPHYSKGNFDLEVNTSYGWIESIGNAYRTDYDLKNHSEKSKKDLSALIEGEGKIMPHVVEPSFGVDRLFWCLLEACYRKSGGAEKRDWEWFDFLPRIAPYTIAVFPLMKKDGLDEKAKELTRNLRENGFSVIYDESGSIGKRYARADEIGVPYCLTLDYDSLQKN
ncbi:glycine--tRNA ligase, partial [Candidatus Micrarchaeota archaeon]|nr:glycine--tRNA ligase [Candidatus Micrarchaeota archaeon]